ncbi:hypothetical protein IBX38_00380 [Candidatus Bathyarchaeota archaeon]|nr:hypothetical protein [Candidatus Bathyarchaeota archaeon]
MAWQHHGDADVDHKVRRATSPTVPPQVRSRGRGLAPLRRKGHTILL